MRTRSVFPGIRSKPPTVQPVLMSYFLVEIPVPQSDGVDFNRVTRTLGVAQSRLRDRSIAVRPLIAGVTTEDSRLIFLIEAATIEAVRNLVSLAMLPTGRIREVLDLALPGANCGPSGGRRPKPGADLAPRVDAELIQDVVHVSLHSPLGDE